MKSSHITAVVEYPDGLAPDDAVGEGEVRHVGPSPGTIDGEETKASGGEAVEMGVAVRHELVALLGGGVEGHG